MFGNVKIRTFCSILLLAALLVSCGSIKGDFGFKTFRDDGYRKRPDPLEFDSREEIQWVYQFPANVGTHRIGIVYLKKELVWVEVDTSSQNLNELNTGVYGIIKNLPAGDFKIVLVEADNGNRFIDERFFTIYTDEDEMD